jgi:hypothetical protein
LLTAFDELRGMLAEAGVHAELAGVDLKRYYVGCDVLMSPGFDPLLGLAVREALLTHVLPNMLGKLSSAAPTVSVVGGPDEVPRAIDRSSVLRVLGFLDHHAIPLKSTSKLWSKVYDDALGPEKNVRQAPADDVEALLLSAILDALVPQPGSFDEKIARWTRSNVSLADVRGVVDDPRVDFSSRDSATADALAWIVAHRFRAQSPELVLSMLARRGLSSPSVDGVVKWLATEGAPAETRAVLKKREDWSSAWAWAIGEAEPWILTDEARPEPMAGDPHPVPLPEEMVGSVSWEDIEQRWASEGERQKGPRDFDLASIAKSLDLARLPPSYEEWSRRYADIGELHLAYVREGFPYFLILQPPDRLAAERQIFRDNLASLAELGAEERAIAKALEGLLPFAHDTSRTSLCWDPAKTNPEGEMLLTLVGEGTTLEEVRTDCGYDLLEVLKYYKPANYG